MKGFILFKEDSLFREFIRLSNKGMVHLTIEGDAASRKTKSPPPIQNQTLRTFLYIYDINTQNRRVKFLLDHLGYSNANEVSRFSQNVPVTYLFHLLQTLERCRISLDHFLISLLGFQFRL